MGRRLVLGQRHFGKNGICKQSIQCLGEEEFADASFSSGLRVNVFTSQELRANSHLQIFSLEEAVTSLECMPQPPSVENFICILHKCRKKKNLAYAKRLHAYMCKTGLEAHRSLGNYLVPILVEVGSMWDAQQVFDRLVDPNEYSWTSLISGYVECGKSQHALNLYQKMLEDGVHPSEYTFVALLKACARLKDAERGRKIHDWIAKKGFDGDSFVASALVDMYSKCGLPAKARGAFDTLPVRDAVSWNALMAAYAKHGLGEEALSCFEQMQLEGVSPDALTFVCSLKACGTVGAIGKGQEIHAEIARKGLLERNIFLGNALVDMYAKCGSIAIAREVSDKLHVRNVVSWTVLIAGYVKHGLGEEAINCFEQMRVEGVPPDAITFVHSLMACGSTGAIDKGQEMHAELAKRGLETDPLVGGALVDMYSKCSFLLKAQEAFDKLPVRDVVSWTALIAGYADFGLGEKALNCFQQMQLEGVRPDALTVVCSLKACGSIGALDKGKEIHAYIARNELLEKGPFVGSTLVDMYANCGLLAKAHEVFDKLSVRNVVSWTALISGYANLGESEIVFHMLERMRGEGIKPDRVTFLSVLTVCNHTGLVDKGQKYFEAMSKDYGITSTIEHHTCIVDLLGRAGQLNEALATMKKMPFNPNDVVWRTVLGACWKWGNVELGSHIFEHALHLNEKDAAAYVLMSNICADAYMKKVETIRE